MSERVLFDRLIDWRFTYLDGHYLCSPTLASMQTRSPV